MYETLMFLVEVHARISKIAEPLLDRILRTLVEELAAEALRCFRQVRRFSTGGMLQVRISALWEFVNACLTAQLLSRPRLRSNSCTKR